MQFGIYDNFLQLCKAKTAPLRQQASNHGKSTDLCHPETPSPCWRELEKLFHSCPVHCQCHCQGFSASLNSNLLKEATKQKNIFFVTVKCHSCINASWVSNFTPKPLLTSYTIVFKDSRIIRLQELVFTWRELHLLSLLLFKGEFGHSSSTQHIGSSSSNENGNDTTALFSHNCISPKLNRDQQIES